MLLSNVPYICPLRSAFSGSWFKDYALQMSEHSRTNIWLYSIAGDVWFGVPTFAYKKWKYAQNSQLINASRPHHMCRVGLRGFHCLGNCFDNIETAHRYMMNTYLWSTSLDVYSYQDSSVFLYKQCVLIIISIKFGLNISKLNWCFSMFLFFDLIFVLFHMASIRDVVFRRAPAEKLPLPVYVWISSILSLSDLDIEMCTVVIEYI